MEQQRKIQFFFRKANAFSGVQGRILSVDTHTGTPSHRPQHTFSPSNPMIRVALLHFSSGVLAPCSRLNSIKSPTEYLPLRGAALRTNARCTRIEQSSAANAPRHACLICTSFFRFDINLHHSSFLTFLFSITVYRL